MGSIWRRTGRAVDGSGVVHVACDSRTGYAKLNRVENEKLSSDLAQVVGVPVPLVEIGLMQGWSDRVAVSEGNPNSRNLLGKNEASRGYSEAERAALCEASGLIPFLGWIGDTDHNDDTNLIVEEGGASGKLRVVAIDFENAFEWTEEDQIDFPRSPALIGNLNPIHAIECASRIEGLPAGLIHELCLASGKTEQVARSLVLRQRLIGASLGDAGWTDLPSLRRR